MILMCINFMENFADKRLKMYGIFGLAYIFGLIINCILFLITKKKLFFFAAKQEPKKSYLTEFLCYYGNIVIVLHVEET